jgi:hypothetical protein
MKIRQVWPSHGPAAHRYAALIVVRVDGHGLFRRFAPLSEPTAFFSADDTGRYVITGALYRCASACREGDAPREGDRRVVGCSLKTNFDGSRTRQYAVVFAHSLTACRAAEDRL